MRSKEIFEHPIFDPFHSIAISISKQLSYYYGFQKKIDLNDTAAVEVTIAIDMDATKVTINNTNTPHIP